MKRLIVGDIHGCHAELLDLLEVAGLSEEDEVIAIGDIVDRGPDSEGVLAFFRDRPRARSLMGNHERKHIRSFRGEVTPALSQVLTRKRLGEERYAEAIALMGMFPAFVEFDEAILVHAFFEPGIPLASQRDNVIIGTLSGETYLKGHYDRPWYELYRGPKPIIVGHRDYRNDGEPLIHADLVYALDTGCCLGRRLTGLLLPDFRVISVPSRRNYWKEAREQHAASLSIADAINTLTWNDVDPLLRRAGQPDPGDRQSEGAAGLEAAAAGVHRALVALLNHVTAERERLLSELRASTDYDNQPDRKKWKLYESRVGGNPLARFLLLAHSAPLTLPKVRSRLKSPGELMRLARAAGLVGGAE